MGGLMHAATPVDTRRSEGHAMGAALAAGLALAFGIAGAARADAVETFASARVDAAPDRVLAVLADFESWNHVFPGVETLGAERQDAHRARLRQRVQRAGYTMSYTLDAIVDPTARRVDLALDPAEPGDLEVLSTTWRIDPLPDGGSLVSLRVRSRSRLPVPTFVERLMTERTAHESLADLVRSIERVAVAERG
jgi:ribosome-associated toxin RatA of RatAB toxin-antitoxin module